MSKYKISTLTIGVVVLIFSLFLSLYKEVQASTLLDIQSDYGARGFSGSGLEQEVIDNYLRGQRSVYSGLEKLDRYIRERISPSTYEKNILTPVQSQGRP